MSSVIQLERFSPRLTLTVIARLDRAIQ